MLAQYVKFYMYFFGLDCWFILVDTCGLVYWCVYGGLFSLSGLSIPVFKLK